MNDQCKGKSSSLSSFLVLVVGSLLLAHLWTVWVLPPFNSNHLGCDACHHAILIHCHSLTDPAERYFLADSLANYPQTAHWLSARWMPLLGGDPYKAMRAVSAASVLLMLVCPFVLLRRILPAGPALLAVLAWQMLCYLTNLANVQYYSVAYFFSQGVGMTFVWLAVTLVTWPAPKPWQRSLLTRLGALCAGIAYLCHIVPGVAILGGLGVYYLLCWWRSRTLADFARLILIGAVGLAVVLATTGQLAHLGKSRQDPGPVPLKNWAVLLAWIPTLLLSLGAMFRWRLRNPLTPDPSPPRRGRGENPTTDDREQNTIALVEVLTCVLGVTGLLQGYCGLEYLLGKAALYSANKFFYVLFPVATLIWVLAIVWWWQRSDLRHRLGSQPAPQQWPVRLGTLSLQAALIGLLLYLNGRVFVSNELMDEKVSADRHPVLVSRQLAQQLGRDHSTDDPRWRSDLIYFDPALAQSSIFVNVVGLHRAWRDAYTAKEALADFRPGQAPPAPLQKQVIPFSQLVVPPLGDQGNRISSRLRLGAKPQVAGE